MPLDLEPIRARLAKATPGKWYLDVTPDYGEDGPEDTFSPTGEIHCEGPDGPEDWPIAKQAYGGDADLIANAPADIAALIEEVERLRAAAHVQSTVADPCRLCGSPMALAEQGSGPGDEELYRCSRVGCSGEYARDISEPRFLVRLEPGVWIAEWKGDPGRTTVKASAKRFPTERSARRALSKARRCREFPLAAVECVK